MLILTEVVSMELSHAANQYMSCDHVKQVGWLQFDVQHIGSHIHGF